MSLHPVLGLHNNYGAILVLHCTEKHKNNISAICIVPLSVWGTKGCIWSHLHIPTMVSLLSLRHIFCHSPEPMSPVLGNSPNPTDFTPAQSFVSGPQFQTELIFKLNKSGEDLAK